MTTITLDQAPTETSDRSRRKMAASFLAGLLIAGGVAIGINVASSDSAPTPATHTAPTSVHVASPGECPVVQGPC